MVESPDVINFLTYKIMLDKSKKENSQKDPMTELFGEPIDVYSTEEAIEDGILFHAGQLFGRKIVLTSNLLATLPKEAIVSALIIGFSKTMKFSRPDLAVFTVGGEKIYVDDNGVTITLMLREDY